MKTLKCNQIGGPSDCQFAISADSFQEIGNICKSHVLEMIEKGDTSHKLAMDTMMNKSLEDHMAEYEKYKKVYNETPEDIIVPGNVC